jgi:hypothetical protein
LSCRSVKLLRLQSENVSQRYGMQLSAKRRTLSASCGSRLGSVAKVLSVKPFTMTGGLSFVPINDHMLFPFTLSGYYVLARYQSSLRGIDVVYVRLYKAPYLLLTHVLLDVSTSFLTCVIIILSETNHRKLSLRSVLPRLSKVSFHPTSPATFFAD